MHQGILDEEFSALARCRQIARLSLHRQGLQGASSLDRLAEMNGLKTFRLQTSCLTTREFADISMASQIVNLEFKQVFLDRCDVNQLPTFNNVESFSWTDITLPTMSLLRKFPNIKMLEIEGLIEATESTFADIGNLKKLESLIIIREEGADSTLKTGHSKSQSPNKANLHTLKALQELKHLHLETIDISDQGIAILCGLDNLEHLGIVDSD